MGSSGCTGLHLLLTYECNYECDHCFVWGGPSQSGTMTLSTIREILAQAKEMGNVRWIYFEGGEPFLYYAVMVRGILEAAALSFQAGIVSNGYWATDEADAMEWLRPLAGSVQDLSVSSDLFHYNEEMSANAKNAKSAAESLGIPVGFISIAQPEANHADSATGKLPGGESSIMFRGRAADKLAPKVPWHSWEDFTSCPFENLRDPGRVHIDPFGNVQLCQGISLGNLFERPLREIAAAYNPEEHPITGPLLDGGPAELARRYRVPHRDAYADACHLCYETCRALRPRFPAILRPDQMYGPLGSAPQTPA